MPDALLAFRRAVPASHELVYFNHAACAPLPAPAAEAVAGFLDEARRQGSVGFRGWLDRRERTRELAARLLGASADEVALTGSTSQGLIVVAEGLDLRPGDRIVVVEGDFPANLMPWFRQRRRGVEVDVVARRDGRVPVQAVMDAVGPRTRVVAVPWVLYDNGYRLDLATLGAALAERNARAAEPIVFCVDAIQGLGAFPLDVEACRIDALAADSHKWLMGLEGIGLLYCRRELLPRLDPPLVSWWSRAEPFRPWEDGAPLQPSARRFEYASMPTLAVYGMHASLGLLLDTGLEAIAARVLELTAALADGLESRGWRVHTPRARDEERSGIVTASHPTLPAGEVVDRLGAAGVSVTPRGAGVRFSPHGWNTAEEVARALEALP